MNTSHVENLRVFTALVNSADQNGRCWAGLVTLAHQCGMNSNSARVKHCIEALVESGDVDQQGGRVAFVKAYAWSNKL
jgi:hypothetical protein